MTDAEIPELAVVGSVNKGKSSLVTTLCEIDSGLVDPMPRSTRESAAYTFNDAANDEPLFRIVDTPGFQQAREALQWVRERVDRGMSEPDAIRSFVEVHAGNETFGDEWRLLQPVLNGAGILYVVDGSAPFNPASMAEMDLLRMTGRPRMAVINQTHPDRDFTSELRTQLSPYFKVVQFNTHQAGWRERLRLWESFRGIDDAWAPVIDEVIDALRREVRQRRREAAGNIADFLGAVVAWEWKRTTSRRSEVDDLKKQAADNFFSFATQREQQFRAALRRLYRHRRNLEIASVELPAHLELPITDTHSWRVFGLRSAQLVRLGVVGGALAGLAVDAAAGGVTHLIPTLSGAVAGGVLALAGTNRFIRARVRRLQRMGKDVHEVHLASGNHPALPFILLDRALQMQRHLENLSHANRGVPDIPDQRSTSITASWEDETIREVKRLLDDLRPRRKNHGNARDALARRLESAIELEAPL